MRPSRASIRPTTSSKRPTTQSRKECENAHSSANVFGYAIFQDSAASVLYARRLLANHVISPINVINEGIDRTNLEGLTNINFVANNNTTILHHLKTQKHHLVPAGDNDNDNDDERINTQTDRVIHYNLGAGPISDFISAYILPRAGPFFSHSTSTRLSRFFEEFTIQSPLNAQEQIVANRIVSNFGIPFTNSVIVDTPSMFSIHLTFLQNIEGTLIRQLFLDQYAMINHAPNVDIITETGNIQFSPTGPAGLGLYDITGLNNLDLQHVKPVWKTSVYNYLETATNGGLNPKPLFLPTFYRAVIPIPISGTGATEFPGPKRCHCPAKSSCGARCGAAGRCGEPSVSASDAFDAYFTNAWWNKPTQGFTGGPGVNLTGLTGIGDYVTTYNSFSLYDLNSPKHSTLAWLAQAYTTQEDLSTTNPSGAYADIGYTLLIIEAFSMKNRRRTTYNIPEHEIQIDYNDRLAEYGYLRQFAEIVASVYRAYTGVTPNINTLLMDFSACSMGGSCQDANLITDYATRESPLATVLGLGASLYGFDLWPSNIGACPATS
jgi:hypothetical protein